MENNFNLKKFLAEGKMLKEDVNKIKTTDELEAYINSLVDDYVQDTIDVAGYDLDWDGNGFNMGISKEELINDFSDYIKGEIKYISEGEMLKEDTNNIYQDFLKTFIDEEILVFKGIENEDTNVDEEVNFLENEKNNIPNISDLLSLAKAIKQIEYGIEEIGGAYLGDLHSDLIDFLETDPGSQNFPEIDELINILNDLENSK